MSDLVAEAKAEHAAAVAGTIGVAEEVVVDTKRSETGKGASRKTQEKSQ